VVSFTPAGASSTAFPPLLLPGPWSSALAAMERIITAEKDAATSDPAMVVVRRELMFTSPLAALNSQHLKSYHKISPHYAGTARSVTIVFQSGRS